MSEQTRPAHFDDHKIYFDESGNQIFENDLLRVYHFTGARKKVYYMYKIAIKDNGMWKGLDVHQRTHKYNLAVGQYSNMDNILLGTQVISRASCDSPDPKYKNRKK